MEIYVITHATYSEYDASDCNAIVAYKSHEEAVKRLEELMWETLKEKYNNDNDCIEIDNDDYRCLGRYDICDTFEIHKVVLK